MNTALAHSRRETVPDQISFYKPAAQMKKRDAAVVNNMSDLPQRRFRPNAGNTRLLRTLCRLIRRRHD